MRLHNYWVKTADCIQFGGGWFRIYEEIYLILTDLKQF